MHISGSCLCQSVRYEVSKAECYPVSHCHCENCRKAHGAAFGTYLAFHHADFRWLAGAELVTRYESSPNTWRCFCSRCGSPLAAFENDEIRCITLGTVDGDPGIRPECHIYVKSKAPWFELSDDLPKYELRSPGTKPSLDGRDQ